MGFIPDDQFYLPEEKKIDTAAAGPQVPPVRLIKDDEFYAVPKEHMPGMGTAAIYGAARNILPTLGGLLAGTVSGVAGGFAGGPAAAYTAPAAAFAGSTAAGYGIAKAQEAAWKPGLREQLAASDSPNTYTWMGLVPGAVTGRPIQPTSLITGGLKAGSRAGATAAQLAAAAAVKKAAWTELATEVGGELGGDLIINKLTGQEQNLGQSLGMALTEGVLQGRQTRIGRAIGQSPITLAQYLTTPSAPKPATPVTPGIQSDMLAEARGAGVVDPNAPIPLGPDGIPIATQGQIAAQNTQAATPAVATPAVATPAVATPAVATPAVATPAAATPVAAPAAPVARPSVQPGTTAAVTVAADGRGQVNFVPNHIPAHETLAPEQLRAAHAAMEPAQAANSVIALNAEAHRRNGTIKPSDPDFTERILTHTGVALRDLATRDQGLAISTGEGISRMLERQILNAKNNPNQATYTPEQVFEMEYRKGRVDAIIEHLRKGGSEPLPYSVAGVTEYVKNMKHYAGKDAEVEAARNTPPTPEQTSAEGNLDIGEVPVMFNTKRWQADANAPNGGSVVQDQGQAPMVEYNGRFIVLRNVNGVQVPFYLSSGDGGKKDVPSGKWYPFFGVAEGWLNKTGGKEMASYYGREDLATVARQLDRTIGDIRHQAGRDKFPKVGNKESFAHINQGLTPAENGTPETRPKLEANMKNLFDRLDAAAAQRKPKPVAAQPEAGTQEAQSDFPEPTGAAQKVFKDALSNDIIEGALIENKVPIVSKLDERTAKHLLELFKKMANGNIRDGGPNQLGYATNLANVRKLEAHLAKLAGPAAKPATPAPVEAPKPKQRPKEYLNPELQAEGADERSNQKPVEPSKAAKEAYEEAATLARAYNQSRLRLKAILPGVIPYKDGWNKGKRASTPEAKAAIKDFLEKAKASKDASNRYDNHPDKSDDIGTSHDLFNISMGREKSGDATEEPKKKPLAKTKPLTKKEQKEADKKAKKEKEYADSVERSVSEYAEGNPDAPKDVIEAFRVIMSRERFAPITQEVFDAFQKYDAYELSTSENAQLVLSHPGIESYRGVNIKVGEEQENGGVIKLKDGYTLDFSEGSGLEFSVHDDGRTFSSEKGEIYPNNDSDATRYLGNIIKKSEADQFAAQNFIEREKRRFSNDDPRVLELIAEYEKKYGKYEVRPENEYDKARRRQAEPRDDFDPTEDPDPDEDPEDVDEREKAFSESDSENDRAQYQRNLAKSDQEIYQEQLAESKASFKRASEKTISELKRRINLAEGQIAKIESGDGTKKKSVQKQLEKLKKSLKRDKRDLEYSTNPDHKSDADLQFEAFTAKGYSPVRAPAENNNAGSFDVISQMTFLSPDKKHSIGYSAGPDDGFYYVHRVKSIDENGHIDSKRVSRDQYFKTMEEAMDFVASDSKGSAQPKPAKKPSPRDGVAINGTPEGDAVIEEMKNVLKAKGFELVQMYGGKPNWSTKELHQSFKHPEGKFKIGYGMNKYTVHDDAVDSHVQTFETLDEAVMFMEKMNDVYTGVSRYSSEGPDSEIGYYVDDNSVANGRESYADSTFLSNLKALKDMGIDIDYLVQSLDHELDSDDEVGLRSIWTTLIDGERTGAPNDIDQDSEEQTDAKPKQLGAGVQRGELFDSSDDFSLAGEREAPPPTTSTEDTTGDFSTGAEPVHIVDAREQLSKLEKAGRNPDQQDALRRTIAEYNESVKPKSEGERNKTKLKVTRLLMELDKLAVGDSVNGRFLGSENQAAITNKIIDLREAGATLTDILNKFGMKDGVGFEANDIKHIYEKSKKRVIEPPKPSQGPPGEDARVFTAEVKQTMRNLQFKLEKGKDGRNVFKGPDGADEIWPSTDADGNISEWNFRAWRSEKVLRFKNFDDAMSKTRYADKSGPTAGKDGQRNKGRIDFEGFEYPPEDHASRVAYFKETVNDYLKRVNKNRKGEDVVTIEEAIASATSSGKAFPDYREPGGLNHKAMLAVKEAFGFPPDHRFEARGADTEGELKTRLDPRHFKPRVKDAEPNVKDAEDKIAAGFREVVNDDEVAVGILDHDSVVRGGKDGMLRPTAEIAEEMNVGIKNVSRLYQQLVKEKLVEAFKGSKVKTANGSYTTTYKLAKGVDYKKLQARLRELANGLDAPLKDLMAALKEDVDDTTSKIHPSHGPLYALTELGHTPSILKQIIKLGGTFNDIIKLFNIDLSKETAHDSKFGDHRINNLRRMFNGKEPINRLRSESVEPEEVPAEAPIPAKRKELKGAKGFKRGIEDMRELLADSQNDDVRKHRQKNVERMEAVLSATRPKTRDSSRVETQRKKLKALLDETTFSANRAAGLAFAENPDVIKIMNQIKSYEGLQVTSATDAEAVLKPAAEGEPASIVEARQQLSRIIKNMSRGEGWDAKKAEAQAKIEQFELENKLLSGEHEPTQEELDIISNAALEEFVSRFGSDDVDPAITTKVENELAARLQLQEQEGVRETGEDETQYGDLLADIKGLMAEHGDKYGIPTLPAVFEAESLNVLREQLSPQQARELMRHPKGMGAVDANRAKNDRTYRIEMRNKAEGQISQLATALSELGWTQFDPTTTNSDELIQAIVAAGRGELQAPKGGVLGAAAKIDKRAQGIVDRLYQADQANPDDPFLVRDEPFEAKAERDEHAKAVVTAMRAVQNKVMTTKDAVELVIKAVGNSSNVRVKEAVAVLKLIASSKVSGLQVKFSDIYATDKNGMDIGGVFNDDAGIIEISIPSIIKSSKSGAFAVEALGHEIVHYHTVRAVKYNSDFKADVRGVMNTAKKWMEENGITPNQYGMNNEMEFLAEGMTNQKFRNILKRIPANRGITGPSSNTKINLFTKLVAKIRLILSKVGINFESNTALERVIELYSKAKADFTEGDELASIGETRWGHRKRQNWPQTSLLQRNALSSGGRYRQIKEGDVVPDELPSGLRERLSGFIGEPPSQASKKKQGEFDMPVPGEVRLQDAMGVKNKNKLSEADFDRLTSEDPSFNPREWQSVLEEGHFDSKGPDARLIGKRVYKRIALPGMVDPSAEATAQDSLPKSDVSNSGDGQTLALVRDASKEQSDDPEVFRDPRPGQSVARTAWDIVSGRYLSGVSGKAHQNAARHPDSEAVKTVANMIHSRPGTQSNAYERDIPTAISVARTKYQTRLNKIMEPLRATLGAFKDTDGGTAKAQREEIYQALTDMITGRKEISSGPIGQAALGLKNLLAEMHQYRGEAGENIAEVTNYFPAVYDSVRIGESRKPFIKDAKAAYEIEFSKAGAEALAKELGISKSEYEDLAENDPQKLADDMSALAETKALALYNSHVRGASADEFDSIFGMADKSGAENPSLKRKFGREAQTIMRKWQVNDPFRVVSRYITSGVKRAELVRKFGNKGEKWSKLSHQMEKDGVPYQIISEMRDLTRTAVGVGFPNPGKAAQTFVDSVTLMTAASAMGRGFLNNLVEPVTMGMRTGSPIDILRAYAETWVRFLREIPALSSTLRAKMGETFWSEYGHEIGTIHNSIEDAWMTTHSMDLDGEYADPRFRWLTNRIYKANLMDASETAKQQASHALGFSFINKLGSMARGDHWTNSLGLNSKQSVADQLSELGVKPEDQAEFADWTKKLDAADLQTRKAMMLGSDKMAKLHQEAMVRFSVQSSVRSNRAHKPEFQDSALGKTYLQLMNFSYSYAAEVNSRMYNMTKQAFAFSPDGKNYSMYDRMRMLGPVAGGMLSILAYRGLLELKDLLYPSESTEKRKKDPEIVKWINATSYAGLLGPKFEQAMKSIKRDQAVGGPVGQMGVNVARAGKSVFESLAEGKDMSAAKKSVAKAAVPVLKGGIVAGSAAIHPALGTVAAQATNAPAFTNAIVPQDGKKQGGGLTPDTFRLK